jgi:Na+/melibiose symporter-like transporter
MAPALPDDIDLEHSDAPIRSPRASARNGRRLPWLLFAALLLAAALSAILLFGSSG